MLGSVSECLLNFFLSLGRSLLPSAKLSLNQAERDRNPIEHLIFLEDIFLSVTLLEFNTRGGSAERPWQWGV